MGTFGPAAVQIMAINHGDNYSTLVVSICHGYFGAANNKQYYLTISRGLHTKILEAKIVTLRNS